MVKYYTEWSAHTPVAIVNRLTRQRWWFDTLDEERKEEALGLPVFDLSLGRMVKDDGSRKHAFIMHRRSLRM